MILTVGGYFYGTRWVAWQQSGYVNRIGGYKLNFTHAPKICPFSLTAFKCIQQDLFVFFLHVGSNFIICILSEICLLPGASRKFLHFNYALYSYLYEQQKGM